jgi:hypothetical protein
MYKYKNEESGSISEREDEMMENDLRQVISAVL